MRAALCGRTQLGLGLSCCAVILALSVGSNLLTALGSRYVTEGGGVIEKIHPSSYAAFFAFGAATLASGRRCPELLWRQRWLAVSLLCFAGAIIWGVLFCGLGNVVVLLDSFMAAVCMGLAIAELSCRHRRRVRRVLQIGFAGNAVLALAEAVVGAHLLPLYLNGLSVTERPEDFRPLALYDHPLTGAAATLLGLFLLPSRRHPWLRRGYFFLLSGSLIAFGSRAAIVAGLISLAWGILPALRARLRQPQPFRLCGGLGFSVFAAAALTIAVAAVAAGVGDRLLQHGMWDASTQARLTQWQILDRLHLDEVLFGTERSALLDDVNLLRLDTGVDVIENFALLFFLTLGVGGFAIFLAGGAALLAWCCQHGGGPARRLTFCFALTALASNSLARKSVLPLLFVATASVVQVGAVRLVGGEKAGEGWESASVYALRPGRPGGGEPRGPASLWPRPAPPR